MKKIIIVISFLCSISVFAADKSSSQKIPFIVEKASVIVPTESIQDFPGSISMGIPTVMYGDKSGKNKALATKTTTEQVPVEAQKITDLVTSIRNSICQGIRKGSIRVWLKFDANAKVLGIGSSSEGGIEVNISCE